MKFSFRNSLKSKSEVTHINEEKKQRWYKTPEFLWHAPFGLVTALLLSFGALNHSSGLIQAGVILLGCTLLSLVLMLYGRRSVKLMDKKVTECRPNARFYHLMTVHKDSIRVLLPHSSAKSLTGVLISLDWGLELWDYKMNVILSSMKWKDILGAEATSCKEGSSLVDILIMWLTDDRIVKFQTYHFANIPEAFILSRPDSDPWISPDGEDPIRWN